MQTDERCQCDQKAECADMAALGLSSRVKLQQRLPHHRQQQRATPN